MVQSVVRSARSVVPVCLVDGPVVRSVVRSSAIRSAIQSVVWSVVQFVGWSMLQSVVRSVQSVVRSVQSVVGSKHVLLHTQYNGRSASDAWTSVAQAADSGLRTVWCCGGVAVLRKGCGGVAVVRSVVPVDDPVGGPVGGMVRSVVRLAVRSVVKSVGRGSGLWSGEWSSLWSGPCGLWSVKARPAEYNGLPASVACSFVTFVILRSPDPGPRTLCPQNDGAAYRGPHRSTRQLFQNL